MKGTTKFKALSDWWNTLPQKKKTQYWPNIQDCNECFLHGYEEGRRSMKTALVSRFENTGLESEYGG